MKRLFPSLPEAARLGDVLQRFERGRDALMAFTDDTLRGDGALGVGEREMIAAYVSALNACRFCLNAHVSYARAFGIDAEQLAALIEDPAATQADPALRPLLHYVRKLTESPSKLTEEDAQAVYAAGWSEDALYDAVVTCALFNMMNRIVEGTGVEPDPAADPLRDTDLPSRDHRYGR